MRSSQMGNYGILTMFCCLWRIWLSRIWHNLTDLIMFSLLEGEPLLSFSAGGCCTCTRTFGVTKEWWRTTKTPDLTLEFDDPFVLYLLLCVCPGQEVQIQSARTAFPHHPLLRSVSPRRQALSESRVGPVTMAASVSVWSCPFLWQCWRGRWS